MLYNPPQPELGHSQTTPPHPITSQPLHLSPTLICPFRDGFTSTLCSSNPEEEEEAARQLVLTKEQGFGGRKPTFQLRIYNLQFSHLLSRNLHLQNNVSDSLASRWNS